MLVRKKKEILFARKEAASSLGEEENLQSLRVWIRKIEQTTTSISSRLSAVEKRLSGGLSESDSLSTPGLEGPIETLLARGTKKNAGGLARLLDRELSLLHNEMVNQQQETYNLKEHLEQLEKIHSALTGKLQLVQTTIVEMNTTLERRMKRTGQTEPFVMRLGTFEVPIELTGIVGGFLAFLIAALVLINQKAVLLSPMFLILVGFLLIGCALLKMVRSRPQTSLRPFFSMPVKTPSAAANPISSGKKEG